MRMNLPVTGVEKVLNDNTMIVSNTDLKGIIQYINRDFIEVSGYTEAELLGAPQNIVRHPDMPPEAFADFWETLKEGKPWTGMVKNRCKNGDHYWVLANATPVRTNGQVTGYMSVRSKPSREQVEAAERAYRMFREGNAKGLRIFRGQVVSDSPVARIRRKLANASVKARGLATAAVAAVIITTGGLLALQSLYAVNNSINTIVQDRMVPVGQLSEISRLVQDNRLSIGTLALGADAARVEQRVSQNQSRIDGLWKDYMGTYLTDEEKGLASHFAADQQKLKAEGLEPALKAGRAGGRFAADQVAGLYTAVNDDLNALIKLQVDVAQQEYAASTARYRFAVAQTALGLLAGVALAFLVCWLFVRSLRKPLEQAYARIQDMSEGRLNVKIEVEREDEVAKILNAARSMQIKLGFDMAEARRVSDENLRIKIGLDNVATNVMVADRDLNIIYMNKAIVGMFQKAESDLKKDLPAFDAARLMGQNIDIFHKNPAHQRGLLEKLTGTHRATIKVGGRTFSLTVTPVVNEKGDRLGTAVEWVDRTAEVAVEAEVAAVVAAAADGDFSRRIALEGKEGFFKLLAESVNGLLDTSSKGLAEVARVLGALAKGDLTEKITAEFKGTFGQLKDDANSTVEQLTQIINRIKVATDTINTAAREIAAGNTDLSQRTEEQASSLEETASSMEELTSTVKQNAENAKQANQLAIGASDIAVKGGTAVSEVVTTMSAINDASRKIADIIGVIDGIAFQTNILALNAAVEAARAGEQGRGFAVVAAEVRSLAQRSAGAAKEIKTLIGDSVGKVEAGSKLVASAGQTMEEIVTSVKRVTDIIGEISAASQEQSSGIEQVNQAITQMDEVTQQNAALVEEASAAARSLEEQAMGLSSAVALFKLATNRATDVVTLAEAAPVARGTVKPAPRPAAAKPAARPAAKRGPAAAPVADKSDDQWTEF